MSDLSEWDDSLNFQAYEFARSIGYMILIPSFRSEDAMTNYRRARRRIRKKAKRYLDRHDKRRKELGL